jgi:putative transposase
MILTHQYRINPNSDQVAMMENWLELLRRHWNYALGQRLDWLRQTRCQIDRCSMISEPIGEIPTLVSYLSQQVSCQTSKLH